MTHLGLSTQHTPEQGISVEELPGSVWPVSMSVWYFLDCLLMLEGPA